MEGYILKTGRNSDPAMHPVLWGISGSAVLVTIYFLILILSNSLQHALDELKIIGIWIALLTAGFGIQAGLFAYIRKAIKARAASQATASVAAAGGISTTAMVACCMHHLTEILPILGISAAAIFLAQYQSFFLAVGVASNLVGITIMLRLIQREELYEPGHGILGNLMHFDMDYALAASTLIGMAFAGITLITVL